MIIDHLFTQPLFEAADPNRLIATITLSQAYNADEPTKEVDLTGRFQGDVKSQMNQAADYLTKFLQSRGFNFTGIQLKYQGMIMNVTNAGSMEPQSDWEKEAEAKAAQMRAQARAQRPVQNAAPAVKESKSNHITQFASNAHEEWRRNFDPTGTKPRIKKNSDGTEGDINVPFADLHPDWQKENLAAAHAAHRAVKHFGRDMEKAAEYVHNEWMKRNPRADYNAAQHVPYDELPEIEKEKDRVHVRTMMRLMGHQPKQGIEEAGNANSGRRGPNSATDNTPVKHGRVEKIKSGIKHHADPSRYGGSEPDVDDDHLLGYQSRYRLHKAVTPDEVDEVAPPGAKAERMVRHIKAGYARDGKLTPKEKGIAFATAWKAHNAGQVEEQGVAEGSLEELANTSLKVKEPKDFVNTNDRKQVTYKVMKFKSGKDTYLINFIVKGPPAFGRKQNWNAVNVSFGVREPQDDYSFGDEINTDLTARNKNQFLIYSTVINAIRKFITEYNTEIDEIIMQGAGERQEAMYQRFFQSAGKYFPGWHHNGKHSLVRDVPRQTGKKVREQGVAEGLTEMDKSEPSAGRDTGPRPGPDREAKPITAKKATKDMGDMLTRAVRDSHKKKDVKEGEIEQIKTGIRHRGDRYGSGEELPNGGGNRSGFPNPGKYARDLDNLDKGLTSKLDHSMGVSWPKGRKKQDMDENINPLMLKLRRALIKEGRVKELADDLKTMSDADFMKKYGKAKAAIRKDMKRIDEKLATSDTLSSPAADEPKFDRLGKTGGGLVSDEPKFFEPDVRIGTPADRYDREDEFLAPFYANAAGQQNADNSRPLEPGEFRTDDGRIFRYVTDPAATQVRQVPAGGLPKMRYDVASQRLVPVDAPIALDLSPKTDSIKSGPNPNIDAKTRANALAYAAQQNAPADAAKEKVDWKAIYALNKATIGPNPNVIRPRMQLNMPNGTIYLVQPGDTLTKIAAKQSQINELSTNKLAQYKTAAAADAKKADQAGDVKRGDKRFGGIVKATKKQFDNDAKQVDESRAARRALMARVVNSR